MHEFLLFTVVRKVIGFGTSHRATRTRAALRLGHYKITVDADECSRFSFLCLGVLAGLAVFIGAMLLLVFFRQPSQSTAGSVVYIAVRVLAISGLFVGLCWAGFFLNLCDGMCEGDKHAEVMIDRFM